MLEISPRGPTEYRQGFVPMAILSPFLKNYEFYELLEGALIQGPLFQQ